MCGLRLWVVIVIITSANVDRTFGKFSMRAEIVAYTSFWRGWIIYVMHVVYLEYSGTPKYRNMLGNSLPVGTCPTKTENYQNSRVVHNKGICILFA